MSKRHDRQESTLERLNLENKRLKQENRHLLKKLKQANKGYYKYLFESDTQEEKEESIKSVAEKICWDCNIGNYEIIIIANRRWRQCNNCGKRGKVSIV